MENSATDYTIIVNTVIRDNRLSASDLGLLDLSPPPARDVEDPTHTVS